MLVVPAGSYRTTDFVIAAGDLRVDLVVASEGDLPMGDLGRSRSVTIDCNRSEWSASRIANLKPTPDAVIAADDRTVVIAAMASNMLGLAANPVGAVSSTRDKAHMRGLLDNAGVPQPRYRLAASGEVAALCAALGFPCVVKPRGLSASRGVIRVDTAEEAGIAEARIRRIIEEAGGDPDATVVVEGFIPGPEVAVEGMLVRGELTVLALLDKPDRLDGPFFEETMFVTPSRHDSATQGEITSVTQAATRALGLVTGPIHAEVRCGPDGVMLVEIAARSIGGLCGRALSFGLLGESLESVIVRSALGLPGSGLDTATAATGVLMLPIPLAGKLVSIENVDDALAVSGVTEFDQTIPNGKAVVPLPEGDRYLGFLFAQGASPDAVEQSLRTAHAKLTVRIDPEGR
ncbi:MAG: ATP-grasp domain-containing protein [Acidimicrobiia bacterium]|nr:MAG: ATP-grasp domain-containing protein [Acidimicrobiia bacterium]